MGIHKKVLTGISLIVLFFCFSLPIFASGGGSAQVVATSPGSDTAPADGSSTASMTVTLLDSLSAPVVGDTVVISLPANLNAGISPASAVTNASGQAIFTISSTASGTFTIDVTDQTLSQSFPSAGQVTFTSVSNNTPSSGGSTGTGIPGCSAAKPISAPDLFQVSTTKTTATLFFAQPPTGGFDGYDIFYGLTQSADSYSVHFQQGSSPAANKYTVNSLTPDKIYYFKIRADNGCAPGPWSPTRQSNYPASGLTKLPETGPSNIILEVGIGGAVAAVIGLALLFAL